MATLLPELLQPAGTPCFLLAGHGITPGLLHDDLPANIGHGRRRRLCTVAPRVVDVSLALNDVQSAAWDEWFESVLIVGSAKFTAEVAPIGSSSRYYAAEWVDPPVWGAKIRGKWQVSGSLLLTGDGSDELPQGTTLVDEYVVALTGTAVIASAVKFSDEYVVALIQSTLLADEYVVALTQTIPTYFEREDGGDILREDGSKLQRQ